MAALSDARAKITGFLDYVTLFAVQVKRRILNGEEIPHKEKVFSIFKPYTRRISKGKAGGLCELGVPAAVIKDQFQFVLGHSILWTGTDKDVAGPLVKSTQAHYPTFQKCSFDRGLYSPAVRKALDDLMEMNALPKKGRRTK